MSASDPFFCQAAAPMRFPMVTTLFRLLDSFLKLREQPQDLTKIFSEYVVWMEKHATKLSEEKS